MPTAPDNLVAAPAGPRLRPLVCCAVLSALAVVILFPSIRPGRVLLPTEALRQQAPYCAPADEPTRSWNALQWDALAQYYPWRVFAQRWLRRGELPLWNPHQFCGMPFLANAQSAVFYPPNLVFWLGDVSTAFGLLAVLRLLAAGAFTLLLARTLGMRWSAALFSAMAYAFCGFMVTWTALPTLVDVAMWLPWVLWSLELIWRGRPVRGGVCLAFGLGLQFLAGHPHMSLYVLMAVALRVAFGVIRERGRDRTRGLRWSGLGLALGLGVGSCQLLPTAELSRYSHRFHEGARPKPLGRANPQALPIEHAALLVAPKLLGDPNHGSYYGFALARGNYADYCGYVGVATLVLAAWGAMAAGAGATGMWLALAAVGLLLALNPFPVAWLMSRTGVTAAALGSPTRSFLLLALGLAVLGGWGVHCLGERQGPQDRRPWALVAWAALVFAAVLALRGVINTQLGAASYGLLAAASPLQTMALIGSGVALAAVTAVAFAGATTRVSPTVARSLLLAILFVELAWFGHGYNPAGKREHVYPSTPLISWLREHADEGRLMPLNRNWSLTQYPQGCLPPNAAMVFELDDIAGYDSLHLARYKALAAALQAGAPTPPENGNMLLLDNVASPLVDTLGVQQVVSRGPLSSALGVPTFVEGNTYVYGQSDALPRAALRNGPSHTSACSANRTSPNRLTIHTGDTVGTLTVADTNFCGWRCAVDGRPVKIDTYLDVFRSVDVNQPNAQVEFVYWPQSLRFGLFLALVSLAALVSLLATSLIRHRA